MVEDRSYVLRKGCEYLLKELRSMSARLQPIQTVPERYQEVLKENGINVVPLDLEKLVQKDIS